MKKYSTTHIRNIGVFGHGGTGKTSLCEAMLYDLGATDRLGRVEEGNTVMDFDPDEHKRHISIYSSLASVEYQQHKLNILDCPGFQDFVAEVVGAMAVVEGAILVLATASGVEVGIETTWSMLEDRNLPRVLVFNKMDKENTDFYKTLGDVQEKLSPSAVAIQIPIGAADTFAGVIDLVEMSAYKFDAKGQATKIDIPADHKERAEEYRARLVEKAAEADDALTEKYLEEMDLSTEDLKRGISIGARTARLFPVVCTSASKNVGIPTLLDAILHYVPSPDERGEVVGTGPGGKEIKRAVAENQPFAALAFKTTADPYVGRLTYLKVYTGVLKSDTSLHNSSKDKDEKLGAFFTMRGKKQENIDEAPAGDIVVLSKLTDTVTGDTLCDRGQVITLPRIAFPEPCISLAVFPKSKGDEDKLSTGLSRLTEEDPTFQTRRDAETRESIISGMGELHLEVTKDRLKRKFGVDVETATPQVPYKESIRSAVKQEGKHKKQTGGHGQFGHVWLEIAPLERGKHFEFHDKIVGGVVPKNFIPSVDKGVRKAMDEGVVAGFPLVDISVTLYDGSYHTVDSSDIAFQIAAGLAIREGVKKASPVLLEPIVTVEVTVPEQYMGDVIGDLNGKRGRILGMDPMPKSLQLIRAQVPLAEMQRYAIDLRSMTQGRGTFKMKFSHYEEVPAQLSEQIIANSKKE